MTQPETCVACNGPLGAVPEQPPTPEPQPMPVQQIGVITTAVPGPDGSAWIRLDVTYGPVTMSLVGAPVTCRELATLLHTALTQAADMVESSAARPVGDDANSPDTPDLARADTARSELAGEVARA